MLIEYHASVLAALTQRDPHTAYAAMHEHEKVPMQAVINSLEAREIFTSIT